MAYDDRYRKFLQFVLQCGSVSEHDASIKAIQIFNERITVRNIATTINFKLDPLAMVMKCGTCEMTGEVYWSVVSTTYEESVTIPSIMKDPQKAFLRAIFSELIGSVTGRIASMDCLNLTTTLPTKISMGDADEFLKKMVKESWLYLENKTGYYHMGIRSILELMPYFKATFQDNFHHCFLCSQVLFHGQKCESCEKVFHYCCVVRYTKARKSNKCPNCETPFDLSLIPNVLSEKAINDNVQNDEPMDVASDDEDDRPHKKSKQSKRRNK